MVSGARGDGRSGSFFSVSVTAWAGVFSGVKSSLKKELIWSNVIGFGDVSTAGSGLSVLVSLSCSNSIFWTGSCVFFCGAALLCSGAKLSKIFFRVSKKELSVFASGGFLNEGWCVAGSTVFGAG